ncbi:glycine--tRNA ligase, chloroplastic/mitochondrial 2-like isoform X2 [Trifolium pratense]|uniref:glycine--tRNA ligase, chloroplastic/mitochondrial 2-like isoform X2 n=1 Tax=Trifolium pratense TaxID=57577 RepID=UPI001E693BB6|nr:glycine--tRNA ligase, chloroplastic/mitochondrial 2-like isoform X2 [Trifolium pratense]
MIIVLAIGTEELPPQDVVDARKQVSVENLITKQTEQEVEVRGPPVSKAFDQEGNPTKVMFSRPIRSVGFWPCMEMLCENSSCGLRNTTSAVVQIENAESYPAAMRKTGVNVVVEVSGP